jgi:hypothetical protein
MRRKSNLWSKKEKEQNTHEKIKKWINDKIWEKIIKK